MAKYTKENPPQEFEDNISLNYKNQNPFFINFNEYWNKALQSKQEILNGKRSNVIKSFFELLDCAANYVFDYEKKREILEELLNKETSTNQEEKLSNKEFRKEVSTFWKNINEDFKAFELLPKPNKSVEDHELTNFYKNEKHRGVREIKKFMTDIFKLSE